MSRQYPVARFIDPATVLDRFTGQSIDLDDAQGALIVGDFLDVVAVADNESGFFVGKAGKRRLRARCTACACGKRGTPI